MTQPRGHILCPNTRRAFTLIELLVTVAIIAMLAGMFLVAMSAATEAAKDARTRAMITKLNGIIMRRYESYHTRRVPIQIPQTYSPKQAAQSRLDALRELMRLELPDRWTDVIDPPITVAYATTGALMARPSVSQAYLRRYDVVHLADNTKPSTDFQGAECLYLIVTLGSGEDGERKQFSEGEIGDVDNDGMPEFLDGWGRPINFLRWAPGYRSDLQNGTDPDPFDPYRVYPDASQPQLTFALFPLIYSAGPDKIYDTRSRLLSDNLHYANPGPYSLTNPKNNNNPFLGMPDASGNVDPNWALGESPTPSAIGSTGDFDEPLNGTIDHFDNIHNHLLGTR